MEARESQSPAVPVITRRKSASGAASEAAASRAAPARRAVALLCLLLVCSALAGSVLAPRLRLLLGAAPVCTREELVVGNLRKGVPGPRGKPHFTPHAPLAQACGDASDTRLNCTLCLNGWRGAKCDVRAAHFPCTAGTCLDVRRCPRGAPLTVHVYAQPPRGAPGPSDCVNRWVDGHTSAEYRSVLAALRASPRHTADAENACLLVPWFDTLCNGNRCSDTWSDAPKLDVLSRLAEALPQWAGGRNHLFFDFSSAHAPSLPIGRGLYAASGFWAAGRSYRRGWDVPLPLWDLRWRQALAGGALGPSDEAAEAAGAAAAQRAAAARALAPRPLLLSFKGQRMFFCTHKLCAPSDLVRAMREGALRPHTAYTHGWVRNALGGIHNGRDVIMATRCERELREAAHCDAECKAACSQDRLLFESVDYELLMGNSSFALILPGIAPMSYRLAEALSYGTVPVILSDFITLPFSHVLDWTAFSVRAPEAALERLPERLRALPAEAVAGMRAAARAAYDRCFESPGAIALCALDELEALHLLPMGGL